MGKRYKTSETTCQAISGALKQLMTQKPLERITVAEIMDTCGMRRQHFYYYFTDIYDLLRWTFEKEALELLQQQQGVSPWQNGFLHLFQYINQNRGGLPLRAGLSGQGIFETAAGGGCQQHRGTGAVRQTAVENGLPAHSPEVEVVICLVTIMMAGAVESWLRGELTQTPEELTRRIDMMFQDYIRGVALRLKAPAAVYT